jgi:hypothetical protein
VADVTLLLLLVALFVGIPAGFLWLARRGRQRRIPGSVLSTFDEVFNPAANNSSIEVQLHVERGTPAPGDSPTTRGHHAEAFVPHPDVPGR